MFRVVRKSWRVGDGLNAAGVRVQYQLTPDPLAEHYVLHEATGADDTACLWIPPFRDGFAAGAEELSGSEVWFCSVRLEVAQLRWRGVTLSPDGIHMHGFDAVNEVMQRTEPLPPSNRWRTAAVSALAAGIRRDAAFDRLPVLADALEDAGLTDELVLNHCRYGPDHRPACWVVDWLLGIGPVL